jgi:hypothetical protein
VGQVPAFNYAGAVPIGAERNIVLPGNAQTAPDQDQMAVSVTVTLSHAPGTVALIPEIERQRLHDGVDVFILYGSITYEDVFNQRHWLKYCEMTGSPELADTSALRTRRPCEEYNDMDISKY